MNRTGLTIALGLLLAIGLLFGVYPELDLKITALFFDPQTHAFPIKSWLPAVIYRDAAMVVAWLFVLPAIIALIAKLITPTKRMFMSPRTAAFLVLTMTMSAGVLTNFTFKAFYARPRPVVVQEFSGPLEFKAWWDPSGACAKNCSFFSGEGATAFWTYAPAALAPPPWRPLAYTAATVFGAVTGGLRITFGGHFFTDVAISGLVSFLVIWLFHGLMYRWPSTRGRFTDERIDAALTRFAWPGYRWQQKLLGRGDVGPFKPDGTPT